MATKLITCLSRNCMRNELQCSACFHQTKWSLFHNSKRNYFESNVIQNSYQTRLSCYYESTNIYFLWRRRRNSNYLIRGYPNCWLKRFMTKLSSVIQQDLEDIKLLLHSKLSNDKKVSKDDLQRQMAILEVLLKDRLDKVPAETLKDALTSIPANEMYSLASRIFSLHPKVGEEASVIAIPLFREAALAGNKNAKYSYGQLLLRGAGGLKSDPVEAANMFTELAEEGHGYAQFTLAGLHYVGMGVKQSFEVSFTLYQVSAENGVLQSFNSLGKMYLNGDGVGKDESKAIEYFMKGVEKGDVQAFMSVAHCYSHGKGVDLNYDEAYKYHQKAAETGYPAAIYNVGTHYFSGKGVGFDMSKAAEYFQKAADQGFTLAEINLGNMYYNGLGVEKDLSKAKELYKKAAPKHHDARLLLEELEQQEEKLKSDS